MTAAFGTGFTTAFALILAIGAQNAFVLRFGILRLHIFWICLVCACSDALLIVAGVVGFGKLVAAAPALPFIMSAGGAIFLFFYGSMRFYAAYHNKYHLNIAGKSESLRNTILICLALTWLNPHVYLDTLGLIGAVSTQFVPTDEKISFGAGAVMSSFFFFFSLGYGARMLAPIMTTKRTWQILDIIIGLIMWMLAIGLLRSL